MTRVFFSQYRLKNALCKKDGLWQYYAYQNCTLLLSLEERTVYYDVPINDVFLYKMLDVPSL